MSADTAAFLARLTQTGAPRVTGGSAARARTLNSAFLRKFGHRPVDGVLSTDVGIPAPQGTIPARHYHGTAERRALVVYFHGGGWVVGDLETYDSWCRLLTRDTGADVLAVDYRLAPEYPFPAALTDAGAAVAWAAAHLGRGGPLVVAGDSAGGNLAAVVAQQTRNGAGPPVDLQVLLYPVLDTDLTTDSYQCFGDEPLLSRDDMRWFLDCYTTDPRQFEDPAVAPLRARHLAGTPAALIVVGDCDPLHDEAVAYHARLRDAGVSSTIQVVSSYGHGFLIMPQAIPSAAALTDRVIEWITDAFNDLHREEHTHDAC